MEGLDDGREVKQDARPTGGGDGAMMRVLACHERRMLRALHGRWPYRRSHCRHDLHWLVRVQPEGSPCTNGRAHPLAGLRACGRRPEGG
jgi:hypothetical protein